ncbi:MAG: hypothetical protein LC803_23930 [Acidobacteria bacterium]|nr:hypothetical protein [Acidobacteriota bacterium]
MSEKDNKDAFEQNDSLEFQLEELEQKIAPGLVAACGGCSGCALPGCSTCSVDGD